MHRQTTGHVLRVRDCKFLSVAGFSLSNYISAEEACDWTGKREAELRVAEKEGACQRRGQARWLWTHGIYQPQVAMISQG